MKLDQIKIDFQDGNIPKDEFVQFHHIITDRGSKYSVTGGLVKNREDIKTLLKKVKSNKKYARATHHTWAARVSDGVQVFDLKNDDGETGAGMVILRMLQRENYLNTIIVVTRWYGGVKLGGDRFRHVQEAVRLWINQAWVET